MPSPVIEMRAVTRRFGETVAIDCLSLVVPPGLIIGFIGPSGAGKTTTIRLLTGALAPSDGEIRVLGEDPRRLSRRSRARIGYMPQLPSVNPELSADENVDFAASLFGLVWPRRRRRVKEVLALVGLESVRRRLAGKLSGGMRRRVELAAALVHDPDLAFLDEPTAGLDPILRRVVWDELHRLRDLGRTIVVTTQHIGEAGECDVVALIADGRLVALSDPDELRRSATGGDVIEVETTSPFDPFALSEVNGVRRIERTGPRSFRAIVDDAGRATPEVAIAIAAGGATVATTREWRPTFDQVFATLVARAGSENEESGSPATTAGFVPAPTAAPQGDDAPAKRHASPFVILQVITRLLAFVGKETVEVVRRPGAALSLVLGPFLVVLLFGIGYQGYRSGISAIFFVPASSGLPTDLASYSGSADQVDVRLVTSDSVAAEAALRAREAQVLVRMPDNLQATLASGTQAVITLETNLENPQEVAVAGVLASQVSERLNRVLIETVVSKAQAVSGIRFPIPPDVVAQPTRAVVTSVAPTPPGIIRFFGPAVLVLVLQHLAVTLVALSLVRDKMSGMLELFRVSPTASGEIILGKLAAFGVIGAAIAGLSTMLLIVGFGVPMTGGTLPLVGILGLVLVSSLGIGLVVALVSDSERTAVQLSLLLLLASILFSGFILNLDEFTMPVRAIAYLLPVTHGIALIQDSMLYGTIASPAPALALGAIAVVSIVLGWVLLRRAMRPLAG